MYHAPSMLVGGKWRGAIGGRTLPVINPCTEEVLGETAAADERDVAEALALGFVRDDSFEDNIRFFLEDDIEG